MPNDYKQLLPTLVEGQVKFIIVGGVAAVVHGSARLTFDLDAVYARDHENIRRLVETLVPRELKKAAGRPKDFEAIAELETILEERKSKTRRK